VVTAVVGGPWQDDLATEVDQTNLDAMPHARSTGDLDLMLRHIASANRKVTADAEFVIASRADMVFLMTDFPAGLKPLGADTYLRVCRRAALVLRQGRIIGPDMATAQRLDLRHRSHVASPFPATEEKT
jgi:hypothetical protein